jgi:uncharacterized repeat protein (TIGR01451 family)
MILGAGAFAEVTLETGVSKVETTLDAGGRVKRQLVPAEEVVAGDELRYTITFSNHSDILIDGERIVITNPIPDGTRYVIGTAGGDGTVVEYAVDDDTFSTTEPAAPPEDAAAAVEGGSMAAAVAAAAAEPGGPRSVRSLRWTYQPALAPGKSAQVHFHVRML